MNADNIGLATTVPIRDAGHNEFWLRDKICENTSILGLGDLDVADKERHQPGGGRLDILLKDADEDAMYEVEIMLGETDEKHIIHTIGYWIEEKRRFPQRKHIAVLVAEDISRRFFEIIHFLAQALPIVAIRATIVEVSGRRALHCTEIVGKDIYEEPDEAGKLMPYQDFDEKYWGDKAPWMLEAARTLLEILKPNPAFPACQINYAKSKIRVYWGNEGNYITFWPRMRGKTSWLYFWFTDKLLTEASEQLTKAKILNKKIKDGKNWGLELPVSGIDYVKSNSAVLLKVAEMSTLSNREP